MDLKTKEKLMRVAIDEAQKATQKGNTPYGAILADLQGNIIDTAHNTTFTDIDPTAHAEINLIRKAAKKLKTRDLSELYLICNAQSCAMCFSAAIKAKINNFIFGYAENETLKPKINVFELSKFCQGKIEIETGILEEECRKQIEQAKKNTKVG